jgi:hypothetical protein
MVLAALVLAVLMVVGIGSVGHAAAGSCDDVNPGAIRGGPGPDVLIGTPGDDIIYGLGGDDILRGGGGDDVLCGGTGDDLLFGGTGDDVLDGRAGADRLRGNAGADVLRGNRGADHLDGGEGQDRLQGGADADVLVGGAAADRLFGGGGRDRLMGDGGADRLNGGGSNDVLRGGTGADRLQGGGGADRSFGDAGNDVVVDVSPNPNTVAGGAGCDVARTAVASLVAGVEHVRFTGAVEPGLCSPFVCTGTPVTPGQDLGATVAANPAGAVFCIGAGVHRTGPLPVQANQTFRCQPGAVLSGAVRLDGQWAADGGLWTAAGAPAAVRGGGTPGVGQTTAVQVRNDLFVNDQPYRRVNTRSGVHANAEYFDGELMYAGTFHQVGGRLWLATNPTGKIVEFGSSPVLLAPGPGTADGGTIEDCTVEKFASDDQQAAINLLFSSGWVVNNVTARLNHTGGLRTGLNATVSGGRYVHNGQFGIMGARNDDFIGGLSDNVSITGIEAAYNNYLDFDPFFHAGGVKYFRTQRFSITDSDIHHNYGVGLWLDFDMFDSSVLNNNIHNNASMGIELEAAFNGRLTGNRIACNARVGRHNQDRNWFWGSAVMLKNAAGYTVTGNEIIVEYGQGIGVVDNQDRGAGPYGVRRSVDNTVANNTITFTSRERSGFFDGRTGVESDTGALAAGYDAADPAANNRLENNTFVFADPTHPHWRYAGISHTAESVPDRWEAGSVFTVRPAAELANLC